MSYEPRDTYVPGAQGGAQVPQFVGQREEAARSYATSAGWTIVVRHVPVARRQPDGFVVHQAPAAGAVAPIGAVLAVDVSRHRRAGEQHGRAWLAGACLALAVTTGVFAALWLEERQHRLEQPPPDTTPDTTLVGTTPDTTLVGTTTPSG